jgi:hypothetical protein
VIVPQQAEPGRIIAQPGVEECELPALQAVPQVVPAAPPRMPLADEELPPTGCGCFFRQTAESVLRSCCKVFWPGCDAWIQKAMTRVSAPMPGASEESETLPHPQVNPSHDSSRDPHRMYCPYTGRCPAPYHFRYVEIPTTPNVPNVPDVPADMPPADAPPADGSTDAPDRQVREVLPLPQRED